MSIIGWLSALFLGLCSIPQVIKTLKEQHCKGLSKSFVFMWGLGEIFGLIYVVPTGDLPLIANYTINTIFVGIIVYYKIKEK